MSISQSVIGKAVAIVLVVFGHLGFIPYGGAIGVSIFLVLSGYGITKSCQKTEFNLKGYWKKRIIKVYFPFVVFSFCVVSFLSFINIKVPIVDFSSRNISKVVLGMFGAPNNPYDPTMWYISFIFLMYISFWCSFRFFEQNVCRGISVAALCIILGGGCIFVYPSSVGIYLYIFSFPIGVICALCSDKINCLCSLIRPYYFIIIIAITACLMYISSMHLLFYECLTVYISLITIPILMRIKHFGKIFLLIGESCYAIYLLEGITMNIMWEYVGKDRMIYNLLCGSLIIVLGVFMHYVWKKFVNTP